jgi:hypothetical protein
MKKQFGIFVLFLVSSVCGQNTLQANIQAIPDLSQFLSLANSVNLVNSISGNGPFTVFAPSNEAITAANNNAIVSAVLQNTTFLNIVLSYHIVNGLFTSANLTGTLVSISGEQITVTNSNGSIVLNSGQAMVTNSTVSSNGILYIINGVLIPPSLNFLFSNTTTVNPQACTNQECCRQRANPNVATGDGYEDFNGQCLIGGFSCVDNTGCLLCHNGNISVNLFNRPICGAGAISPLGPCSNQTCCTSRISPNTVTGYGYLEFTTSCASGGTNCVDDSSCLDCFNPSFNTSNVLGRPVCSSDAIASFGSFVPISTVELATTVVNLATSQVPTTVITTVATTVPTTVATTVAPTTLATETVATTETLVTSQAPITTVATSETLVLPTTQATTVVQSSAVFQTVTVSPAASTFVPTIPSAQTTSQSEGSSMMPLMIVIVGFASLLAVL